MESQMIFYAKIGSEVCKEGSCDKEERRITFEVKNLMEMEKEVGERIIKRNYQELVEYYRRQRTNE